MLTYMQIGSCSSLIPIFLLRCLRVVSRKLLTEDINFTCPAGGRTAIFTWSFDLREGLAVCRVKAVPLVHSRRSTPLTFRPVLLSALSATETILQSGNNQLKQTLCFIHILLDRTRGKSAGGYGLELRPDQHSGSVLRLPSRKFCHCSDI